MRNYIDNSRFRNGQAPASVSSSGAWGCSKFWVGPGTGAVANVSFPAFQVGQTTVSGNPATALQVAWTTCPTAGETQYNPGFRWTWLEHHMYNVPELFGQTINITGALKVAVPSVYVVPIVWANWDSSLTDYTIWDQPGITVGSSWVPFNISFNVPDYPLNKVLDSGHYLGFGFDFVNQTAPIIDVAPLRLWNPNETVSERHYALDAYISTFP